jgi:hypothetical protein
MKRGQPCGLRRGSIMARCAITGFRLRRRTATVSDGPEQRWLGLCVGVLHVQLWPLPLALDSGLRIRVGSVREVLQEVPNPSSAHRPDES